MSARPINPLLKQALELGPTLVFFVVYMLIRDETFTIRGTEYSGFIVAAVILIPLIVAAMAALWALTGKLSRIQLLTVILVIFFGSLTAWFNDERFFKMKTTIVYGSLATVLGIGLLQGRSYLQWVMGELVPMQEAGWMILTRRLCAMFAGLAIANEIIWRTQSTEVWVTLETFGMPAVLFVFLFVQFMALEKYVDADAVGEKFGMKPADKDKKDGG